METAMDVGSFMPVITLIEKKNLKSAANSENFLVNSIKTEWLVL